MTRLKVPSTAAKEMNAGRIQPMIIVMMRPSPTSVMPKDTECTDVPGGPQVLSFYTQDVAEALMSTYRVATSPHALGRDGRLHRRLLRGQAGDEGLRPVHRGGVDGGLLLPARRTGRPATCTAAARTVKNDNSLIWRLQHLPPPPISVLITTSPDGETRLRRGAGSSSRRYGRR